MRISQSWMPGLLATVAAFSLAALVSACSEDHPCSADEEFRGGYCYPTDAGQPTDASAGGADDGGGGGTFGQTCATAADCAAPASFCAPSPLLYCTAFGCDTDPTVCPAGWTCLDLTNFGAPGQHMCLKP
ncbi:MAG: hypothetical protein ABSF35_13030 [Polyangia bacterium]|jgi:hypothetical protein